MDVRAKLVEMLDEPCGGLYPACELADYLIDQGVTVQENMEISDELLKQLKKAHITTWKEEPSIEIVQEWILVKDRLPENDQLALCFMKDKSFGTFRVFQWNYIDWQWNDGNEWFDEKDVTHWMPLPEPPKGE